MNNRKKMILGAILLMAVGFATVATTLFINQYIFNVKLTYFN